MLTSSPGQLKEPCVLITPSGEEEEYIHREEKFYFILFFYFIF